MATIKTSVIEGSAAKAGVDVKAQAVYNGTDIWFRFEWADATESAGRFWEYDGAKWKSQAIPMSSDVVSYDTSIVLDRQDRPTISHPYGSRWALTRSATAPLTSGSRPRCPVIPMRIT